MFQKILLPTDFSECSQAAIPIACDLARRYGAQLHCLYVVEDAVQYYTVMGPEALPVGPLPDEIAELARTRMDEFCAANLGDVGPPPIKEVAIGRAFVEIINYAREKDIDLIVLATHGHGMLAHALLGSTAEKVVRKAHCPVLTVHHEKHKFEMP